MGLKVYSLLWVMQDLYHQPQTSPKSPSESHCGKVAAPLRLGRRPETPPYPPCPGPRSLDSPTGEALRGRVEAEAPRISLVLRREREDRGPQGTIIGIHSPIPCPLNPEKDPKTGPYFGKLYPLKLRTRE